MGLNPHIIVVPPIFHLQLIFPICFFQKVFPSKNPLIYY